MIAVSPMFLTELRLVAEKVPSSQRLVNSATRIMSVPASDMTYHSTDRIVTMMVHILALLLFFQ